MTPKTQKRLYDPPPFPRSWQNPKMGLLMVLYMFVVILGPQKGPKMCSKHVKTRFWTLKRGV